MGIRLLGLALLGFGATLFSLLPGAADRVGRHGPTLVELGIAILCFLSFSVGVATVSQGLALFRPAPRWRPVDNPGSEEQTPPGEQPP